jgi:hypothetical protein
VVNAVDVAKIEGQLNDYKADIEQFVFRLVDIAEPSV